MMAQLGTARNRIPLSVANVLRSRVGALSHAGSLLPFVTMMFVGERGFPYSFISVGLLLLAGSAVLFFSRSRGWREVSMSLVSVASVPTRRPPIGWT
jgi:hypothetical protein